MLNRNLNKVIIINVMINPQNKLPNKLAFGNEISEGLEITVRFKY